MSLSMSAKVPACEVACRGGGRCNRKSSGGSGGAETGTRRCDGRLRHLQEGRLR